MQKQKEYSLKVVVGIGAIFFLTGIACGWLVWRSDTPAGEAMRARTARLWNAVKTMFGSAPENVVGTAAGLAANGSAADGSDSAASNATARAAASTNAKTEAERQAAAKKKEERLRAAAEKRRAEENARKRAEEPDDHGHGGTVHLKAGGASRVEAGKDGVPHVASVQGVEFGTQTGLNPKLKPYMVVNDTDEGRAFRRLVWRSDVQFDDGGVYGFDKAWMTHTYDTKELASMTFHKEFKMDAEGVKNAAKFYDQMMAEVERDLGIKLKTYDNIDKSDKSALYGFRGKLEGTEIAGSVNTWSEGKIHVTLRIGDQALQNEVVTQSNAAYDRNDPGLETTRVSVSNRDRSAFHEKAVDLLGR